MTKDNSNKNYLNKKVKKTGMKESLLFGNGPTMEERKKNKKKYKKNKLNENK